MTSKRFSFAQFALLAIVSFLAIGLILKATDLRTASVTRVNNLEVTGTTQATGEVAAITGIRLTNATTGPFVRSGIGDPNGAITATQGSLFVRTDTVQVWQNTNGAQVWIQIGSGSNANMSATIMKVTRPASVNLSTEGTVDWMHVATAQPITNAAGIVHAPRAYGGWLVSSYRWRPGTSGTATVDTSPTTYTTTALSDLNVTALNTTTDATYHNSSGSTTSDEGWLFRVPAGRATRRVRVYAANRSNTLTVTVSASDGSMPPVSVTNTTAAHDRHLYEIDFTGPLGTELIVSGMASAGTAAFPVVGCGAITVADL